MQILHLHATYQEHSLTTYLPKHHRVSKRGKEEASL